MTSYIGVMQSDINADSLNFNSDSFKPVTSIYHTTATLSPTAVTANETAEQTFTVAGVNVGDVVFVNKPTAQAGLGIVGARVSAANTVGITFSNNTGSSITPTASEVYQIGGIR